jgi:ABC-type sugar transport system substrate-binding protein
MPVRRRLALLISAGALAGSVAAAPAATPTVAVAKSCSGSFTHAVINGAEKCLRRGEYCAHAADQQYRRYGFYCRKRDARGSYHLT